jgi:hypothetical protein
MPTIHNIPARTERRCSPCEFLKQANMLCSRLHGITCDYLCHNPDAFDDTPLSTDPKIAAKQGAMRERMAKHGRMIGRDDIQPAWCPLRREPAAAKSS